MSPSHLVDVRTLVLVFDLCGTFVFALSGATAGVKYRLDIFGVLVLSFAAAIPAGSSGICLSAQCPHRE